MQTTTLTMRTPFNWKVFLILLVYYLLAAWALMPLASTFYTLQGGENWLSTAMGFVLRDVLPVGVLGVGAGMALARQVGTDLPLVEGWLDGDSQLGRLRGLVGLSILASLAGILAVFLISVIFAATLYVMGIEVTSAVAGFEFPAGIAAWKWFLASFYGAAEEIPFRFGLLTLLAWLAGLACRNRDGRPSQAVFWIANSLAALAFGAAHLFGVVPYPETPIIIARILVHNTTVGMIFGWLYWYWGLESAMLAHFTLDLLTYTLIQPALMAATPLLIGAVLAALILMAWWAWRTVAAESGVSLARQSESGGWRWSLIGGAALIGVVLIFGLAGRIQQNVRGGSGLAQDLAPMQTIHSPQAGESTRLSEIDGMRIVYIPAGDFVMGADDGEADERPRRAVYLDAFWIDQSEVTNGMYARCVADGACTLPHSPGSQTRPQYYGNPAYDNYPVIYVDWRQANAYCSWAGRRLPSEAEWEKAARGVDGHPYPWGETLPDDTLLNYGDRLGDTTAVGSYPAGASPYGALDMLGNVLEWVSDCYERYYYAGAPWQNPSGPAICRHEHRVIRGAVSWEKSAHGRHQVTNRLNNLAGEAGPALGFRCALSP